MQPAARMPLFGPRAALALLAGVGLTLLLPLAVPWWLAAPAFAGGLVIWLRARRGALAGAMLTGAALAALHVAYALSIQLPPSLERQDARVTGVVADLPVHEVRRTSFLFDVAREASQPPALRGRRLRLSWYEDAPVARATLMPGERWTMHVRLRAPRGLRNPGGADNEKFALAQRLTATGYLREPHTARRLSAAHGIDAWRARMAERIDRAVDSPANHGEVALEGSALTHKKTHRGGARAALPAPGGTHPGAEQFPTRSDEHRSAAVQLSHSGDGSDQALSPRNLQAPTTAAGSGAQASSGRFIRALALGDVRELDDQDWQVLRADGLTHLIAISGFHVGLAASALVLLARLLWWLLPAFARRVPAPIAAAVAGSAGALLYTLVAGCALPTVRTAVAIALVALARVFRRAHTAIDSLALTALLLLAFDPLAVLGAGFWLSFVGVAWLLWCLPATNSRGVANTVRGFLSAQGVATLGLLPLAALLFGQASVAGPIANILAVPWWSLVVVPLSLGGLALETAHAGWGAGLWRLGARAFDLSWPTFERLAGSKLSLVWLPEPAWYALPLALLGAFWLLLPFAARGKWLACLLWLPLLWPDRALPRPGEAELLVVDVGQGLSVVVRTARHTLLYDMGPAVKDGFDAGERAVVPALHALGVRGIDRAIASHGDNDHVGGLDAVRVAFPLGELLAPAGSPVRRARNCELGESWTWDGVRFRVLHPTPYFPYLGNESSCVLRVETAHGAALLPGDIGELIERELVRRDPASLRSEVVGVAHHGRGGSSEPAFLAAAAARGALVCPRPWGTLRHPRPEVVERWRAAGADLLDTQDAGAVRIGLREGGMSLQTRRASQRWAWDAVARTASQARRLSYRPD